MSGKAKYNVLKSKPIEDIENRIRMEAILRVERNDHIIPEGYAERQIADTLSRVEKIRTEL